MVHANVVSQTAVGLINVADGSSVNNTETLTLDTRQYDAGGRVVATGAQGVAVDAFKTLYGTTSTRAVVEGLGTTEHLTQYDGFGQMR